MRVNMGREGHTSSSLSANGGSMLGALILANGPSQPLEAATKYYVDTTFASLNANNVLDGVLPISSLPGFTGDATSSQGSNVITLTNLGVTPGGYAKVIVDAKGRVTGNDILTDSDIPTVGWGKVQSKPNTLEGYGITDALSITGGTFGGQMSVVAPTNSMSAVNKQYVDAALSGNSAVVGDIIRKPYASTPTGFLRCNGGIVDKTMYADLYAVIGDNFSVNTPAGVGRPWEQQYQINDIQSGNITNWSVTGNLPYGCLYHQCVITKHRIFIIGGGNSGSRFSSVYTAPIQSDGAIGVWTASNSALPGEFAYFTAFVTKNYLYVIGGGTNTVSVQNVVYVAAINADGTLGTWTTAANFPIAINSVRVVVLKSRVYVLGGQLATGTADTIYTAPINSDGTLGGWSLYGTLPAPSSQCFLAVTKNRIYMIGGSNSTGFTNAIYSCVINPDETLGTWSAAGTIPLSLTTGCVYVTKNCVYLLGGAYATNTYSSNMYRANINIDGTLTGWELMGNLPYTLGYSTSVVVKNKIHILGGYLNSGVSSAIMTGTINSLIQDYSPYYETTTTPNYLMPGSGKPWQQQYQINTTQTGDITGWVTNTPLPTTLAMSQVVVTKNRVYLLSGWNGSSYVTTVYTTTINSDGTLGTWTTSTSLPGILAQSQAIVTKNRVYLLGGYSGGYVATVYTAPINSDGTLGTWVTGTSLPGALSNSQAIVTKNRVYLLGGSNNSGWSNTVYTAPINTDGTLGAWSIGASLPTELGFSQAIVTKNRVYLLGGSNNSADIGTIYTAPINTDGTLGVWSISGNLPTALTRSSSIVTKNCVYLLSGFNNSTWISTVYTAPINSDGTLGTWTTSTSLPGILAQAHLFTINNHIYICGGQDGGGNYLNTMYSAIIAEGLNDYSAYYDGSILPIEPIDPSTFFALPDFSGKEKNGINFYIKY